LDWSYDSLLLRSTCQAYELLCWDVPTGKLNTAVNVADIRWKTNHCVLGFSLMGIWPPYRFVSFLCLFVCLLSIIYYSYCSCYYYDHLLYSDGTDINAVDVCEEKGLAVSANDDAGLVRLFNYPCIVKNAPAKDYGGHSSHVTNIKFIKGGDSLVTAGGNDGSAMIFSVVREENNPFPAFK
jgi:WD40 repeat protein